MHFPKSDIFFIPGIIDIMYDDIESFSHLGRFKYPYQEK
jgi:hypothetical protein